MYQISFTMSPAIMVSSLRPSKAEVAEIKLQLHRAMDATVDDAIVKLRAGQRPKKRRRT